MLTYPNIDPVALNLGPIQIHWYGVMYLLGFSLAYLLLQHRAKHSLAVNGGIKPQQVSDLVFYAALGVLFGGRIGYFLFYVSPDQWLADPLGLFKLWQGGMSFHGGLLGVLVALAWSARQFRLPFLQVADFGVPVVPLGLALGRIGNFIGNELWGREAPNLPWGMVFPGAGDIPRHPSQIYQMLLEGVLLFILLWIVSRKPRPTGLISGLFLAGYGIARFSVEFFRAPDAHIGFIAMNWVTMGHLLSSPMILAGAGMIFFSVTRNSKHRTNP